MLRFAKNKKLFKRKPAVQANHRNPYQATRGICLGTKLAVTTITVIVMIIMMLMITMMMMMIMKVITTII